MLLPILPQAISEHLERLAAETAAESALLIDGEGALCAGQGRCFGERSMVALAALRTGLWRRGASGDVRPFPGLAYNPGQGLFTAAVGRRYLLVLVLGPRPPLTRVKRAAGAAASALAPLLPA